MSVVNDPRAVMTLDAGGTNFVFSAMRANRNAVAPFVLPAHADNLERSLASIKDGFRRVLESLGGPASAISFAFPGPCDYFSGIVDAPRQSAGVSRCAAGGDSGGRIRAADLHQ